MDFPENEIEQEKKDYFPYAGDVVEIFHSEIEIPSRIKLLSVNKIDATGNVSPEYKDVASVYTFSDLPDAFHSKYPRAIFYDFSTNGFFYENKEGRRIMLDIKKSSDQTEGMSGQRVMSGSSQQH